MKPITVAVAALALFATGCSVSEEAGRPATADSHVPSPATPAETRSADAKPGSAEPLEDFINDWLEAAAHMQTTGDATRFAELSSGCGDCQQMQESIAEHHSAGRTFKSEPERVTAIELLGVDSLGKHYAVTTETRPGGMYSASGEAISTHAAGVAKYEFFIRNPDGLFTVTAVSAISTRKPS